MSARAVGRRRTRLLAAATGLLLAATPAAHAARTVADCADLLDPDGAPPEVRGDGAEVLEACNECVRDRGGEVPAARCSALAAGVHLREGAYEQARSLATQALRIARGSRSLDEQLRALNTVGDAEFYLRRPEAALDSFHAALEVAKELGDPFREALTLKNIGITYANLGRLDLAMLHLERSTERYPDWEAEELGVSVLGNLGSVYRRLGAHRLALTTFENALALARRRGRSDEIRDILGRIGFLYLDVDAPGLAHEFFERALSRDPPANVAVLGWLLEGAATAYESLGELDRALEALRRYLETQRSLGDKHGIAYGLTALGRLLGRTDPQQAIAYFEEGLAQGESVGFDWAYGALAGLAGVHRRKGDLDAAVDAYMRDLDRLEAFRNTLWTPQERIAVAGGNRHVYHELIETLLERHARSPGRGDAQRAFHVFERAGAQALLEAIVEARIELARELAPELQDRETTLRTRLKAILQELSNGVPDEARRADLRDELTRIELETDELAVALRRESPLYASMRYPNPLGVEETQALLDDRTALIAYMSTRQRVLVFVVTANAFHAQWLEVSPETLAGQVRNYLELLADDGHAGWRAVSRDLHDELVAPVRRRLGPEILDLIVVPDGFLHGLPFETLIGTDPAPDRPRLLIEDFGVSYAPCATVLGELMRSGERGDPAGSLPLLLFANPDLSDGGSADTADTIARVRNLYEQEGLAIGPVPYSRYEGRAVQRYAGPASVIRTGSEASEEAFKSLPLESFRLLHFATHGLISQNDPSRSALVLAPGTDGEDGFLQAREIARLELDADLVVLSACRTARGRVLAGAGAQGLAQAFFRGGARSVVGSLWDVEDRAAAHFMQTFYRRLAEGHSKARALRLAKLDHLRRGATADPSRWAPFVLSGEPYGKLPIHAQGRRRFFLWAGLVVAASLLAGLGLGRLRVRS